jgi:hypothetical protein
MRIIVSSMHLEQQQERAEHAAGDALRRPIARPAGFWRQVGWWLSGHEVVVRLARLSEAQERESDALRYARGRAGEDLLVRVLARHLDDRYMLLRNYMPGAPARQTVQRPAGDRTIARGGHGRHSQQDRQDAGATGVRPAARMRDRRGDIDAVLVGPHGVTTFEVKAWRGYFRVSGDAWYVREGPHAGWHLADKNPSFQALENAKRLTDVLADARLGAVPVRPVVAVAGTRMYVEIEPPLAVAVFFATQPQRNLAGELGPPVLDDAKVHQVLEALMPTGG